MKRWKAKKTFFSPLVGQLLEGQEFLFGETAKERFGDDLVEEVKLKTKPSSAPKTKTKK